MEGSISNSLISLQIIALRSAEVSFRHRGLWSASHNLSVTRWCSYFREPMHVCMLVLMFSATELVKKVPVQKNSFFIFILRVCLTFQVRREYRKFFRANAGRKIYEFTLQRIVCICLYKVHVHFLCFKFLFSIKCSCCVMIVFVRKCPSTWKSDKLIFWYCKERIVTIFGDIRMVLSICHSSVIPKSVFLNIPGFKNPYCGLWELRVAVW